MIVSKTATNNTAVNTNNNGVTFTDKPVESQAPVSAAPVSAKASVAPSEAASQAPASAASQAVRSQAPASQTVESAAPASAKASAAVKNVANNNESANNLAAQQTTASTGNASNVQHYVKVPFKAADPSPQSNIKYQELPDQTFTQDMTYVDQVTGKSVTGTTSYTGKKGDGMIVCDPALEKGWCVPENIPTKIPSAICQPEVKITLPVVNPYNVAQASLEELSKNKSFDFMSMPAGNSIYNPVVSVIPPGTVATLPIKINFVTKDGKNVGSITIDNDNYDGGSWAAPVKAPQGYKFVDPRENWVALNATGFDKNQEVYNYPVELASSDTTPATGQKGSTTNSQTNKGSNTSNKPSINSSGTIVPSNSITGKVIAKSNGYEWIQNGNTIKFIHPANNGKVILLRTFNDVSNVSYGKSSMPNTGMSDEVAAELGMVGAGLVLGLVARRKNKNR